MDTMIEIRPGRWIKVMFYRSNPLHPTIFMIHGLGGRGYQWRKQVKQLQNHYNLIVPDLLGQGESEKPHPNADNIYSFSALSQDIQAIFDRFCGKTNYVFGHSYGGAFAVWLAQQNQNKIQKLVLITPVSCQPFSGTPLVYLFPPSVLEFMRSYLDKSFEKLAFTAVDDPVLMQEEKAGRDQNRMYVIKALLQGMKMIPSIDVSQLKLPCLIISGKQDKVIPTAVVTAFYTQMPQHRLYVFEGAAHMVQLEKSVEVNRLVDEFLAE